MLPSPLHVDRFGTQRAYIRFAALGDSATYGIGDREGDRYRGWAGLLITSMSREHDVSACNVAVPGARVADVLADQLDVALEHRPHLASLIVGLNDTLRTDWDPDAVRRDLLVCAEELSAQGAVLMTTRFHDHTRVFRLPPFLARPMRQRIEDLNDAYDEIHQRFGGIMVDLASHPGIYDREFWSVDRLHPSELGHRALADEFAGQLAEHGLRFDPPGLILDRPLPTRAESLRVVVNDVVPWVVRRLRELAPVAVKAWRNDLAPRVA